MSPPKSLVAVQTLRGHSTLSSNLKTERAARWPIPCETKCRRYTAHGPGLALVRKEPSLPLGLLAVVGSELVASRNKQPRSTQPVHTVWPIYSFIWVP